MEDVVDVEILVPPDSEIDILQSPSLIQSTEIDLDNPLDYWPENVAYKSNDSQQPNSSVFYWSIQAVRNFIANWIGNLRFVNYGTATLSSGVVTIPGTWVNSTTYIFVLPQSAPGVTGTDLYADPADFITGVSFKIRSSDSGDNRNVFWVSISTGSRFSLSSIAGSLGLVGSLLTRKIQHWLITDPILSFVGNLVGRRGKWFNPNISFVGTLTYKWPHKRLLTTLSFLGSSILHRFLSRRVTGSLNFVGTLFKPRVKTFTGSLSFSGNLSSIHNP